MTLPGQQTSSNAAPSGNGQSSLHDLFAMTDEQILEIEPESEDVLVAPASLPAPSSSQAQKSPLEAGATSEANRSAGDAELDTNSELDRSAHDAAQSTSHPSPVTSHPSSEPPVTAWSFALSMS